MPKLPVTLTRCGQTGDKFVGKLWVDRQLLHMLGQAQQLVRITAAFVPVLSQLCAQLFLGPKTIFASVILQFYPFSTAPTITTTNYIKD